MLHRFSPRRKLLRDQVMQFLISAKWVAGEARRQGIAVSDAAVKREFERDRRANFPSRRAYLRFLRDTGERTPDLLYRTRIDLLSGRLQDTTTLGGLAGRWRPQTRCRPAYRVSDCGSTL